MRTVGGGDDDDDNTVVNLDALLLSPPLSLLFFAFFPDIDSEVLKITEEAYAIALKHIQENREAIDKIVEELMDVETMDGDRFREMLAQYTPIPEENIPRGEIAAAAAASAYTQQREQDMF